MAEKSSIDLQSIEIMPLANKQMLKGAFLLTTKTTSSYKLDDANNNEGAINFYKEFGFVQISQDASERTVRMFFKLPD